MTDTDKPTNRTPEPSHTVRALRNSVLHAIRERDEARRQAEFWKAACLLSGVDVYGRGHRFPWEFEKK